MTTYQLQNVTPTGDTEIINAYAPGLVWDERQQKMVAWGGQSGISPANVYVLHIGSGLSSYRWERITPAAGITVTPTSRNQNGTYSRFQYSPGKNVFVLVNRVSESVYIYRLTAGSGTGNEAKAKAEEKGRISVRPNPFHASVAISTDNLGVVGTRQCLVPTNPQLAIYDVHGRMVHTSAKWTGNLYHWTPQDLPNGVYLIKTKIQGKTITKKLFLQR